MGNRSEWTMAHWVGWLAQALVHVAESRSHEQAVDEAKDALKVFAAGVRPESMDWELLAEARRVSTMRRRIMS